MDHIEKRKEILSGDIKRILIVMALPIMLNNFLQTVYNLADTYWVGRLGATEVAAMSLTYPIINLMMSLGMGMSIAGSAIIAFNIGEENYKKAEKVSGQLLLFAMIFSVGMAVFMFLFLPTLLTWMGATGELYDASYSYLSIMVLGMPTTFGLFTFNSIKQGQGDTKTPMKFGVIAIAMNMILDPVLIFGLGLGIRGAAVATIFSKGLIAIIAISTLFKKNDGIKIKKESLKFDKDILKTIFNKGLPASLGQSTEAVGFVVLSSIVMSFGTGTMAAFGIVNRMNGMIIMPCLGLSTAMLTIVGQNLGVRNKERAKQAGKEGMKLGLVIMVAGALILGLFGEQLVSIFTDDPEVIVLGTRYASILCWTVPTFGLYHVWLGAFKGAGQMKISMALQMSRLWAIRIPTIYVLGRFFNMGADAVWFGVASSNMIICIISGVIYFSGRWLRLEEEKEVETEFKEVSQAS